MAKMQVYYVKLLQATYSSTMTAVPCMLASPAPAVLAGHLQALFQHHSCLPPV